MRLFKYCSYSYCRFIRKYSSKANKVEYARQTFSGIQPTGNIHLGNYLGAVQSWVKLQNSEPNVIFCIADLHSITVPQDPKILQQNILEAAATVLASGIDPNKSVFFQQSAVKQHSELCWILGTLATMAKLSHLPQYKEKSQMFKEIPLGIFVYPILQAADILLYKTTHVPVGEDQVRQIELARHLADGFNNRFGETFPRPTAVLDKQAASIKNLKDPSKKMSKSEKNEKTRINLIDTPDEILKKCRKAITDFTSNITYDPENRPGVSNLVLIHSLLTNKSPEMIVKESENLDTSQYKSVLAEVIIDTLKPIQKKLKEYLDSPEHVLSILEIGAEKARERAEVTLQQVKERVGLNAASAVADKKYFEKLQGSG